MLGQLFTGWLDYNDELKQMQLPTLTLNQYLGSGHFLEATFENWESEFLQMGLFVLLTVWFRQKGSAESKKLYEQEEVDREPKPAVEAPWPVNAGGLWLKLYKNSLSLAFFLLFLLSFLLHAYGGMKVYNVEQVDTGEPTVTMLGYMASSRFWFESFQNWQSEFVSIFSIVLFSVFLRQKGSPESKPVDMPHSEMES
ncbi:hypothetical protein AAE02nite_31460 [Adhaeribacter aerolatus]|uniref:Uncharacterized protein n=2 Tax=Adhaeribacter aerolatus TaxID=670289 RepID=A0A512B0L2_9BACT|nr:hypothetical protein AAE02nite_31460 [Adhaeribacter aerolatus]